MNSCRSFVEIDPPKTQLTNATVFSSDATANAAMLVVYTQLAGEGLSYQYLGTNTGLLSDEFDDYSSFTENIQLNKNAVLPDNGQVSSTWSFLYKAIYECNSILESIQNTHGLSEEVKDQLKGEALFTRSFCYFYLLQFFGDVPWVTSTAYNLTALQPRNNKDSITSLIIEDLLSAKELISEQYVGANGIASTAERLRPNKAVVNFLLSKISLFQGDYDKAIQFANEVINSGNYELETDLNQVFLTSSKEAIWQLSNGSAFNTFEGFTYILTGYPGNVAFSEQFINRFSGEDLRFVNWIESYRDEESNKEFFYPVKYKIQYSEIVSEYVTVFRLGELYLIRSEAETQLNLFNEAVNDLHLIQGRANVTNTLYDGNKEHLLSSIILERSKELFTEWGNRWFDLIRANNSSELLSEICNLKATEWADYKKRFPVPQAEINRNGALLQNTGY